MNLRGSNLGAKRGPLLIGRGVHVVAVQNLVSQIFVDGAGLVSDLQLPEPWHPEEEVLIVDETLILRQALVVVPNLPVHAVEKRSFCEL